VKDVTFCKSKLTFYFFRAGNGVEYAGDGERQTIPVLGVVSLVFNERSEVSNEVGFYGFNLPCKLVT
jgi:hypothetical protein